MDSHTPPERGVRGRLQIKRETFIGNKYSLLLLFFVLGTIITPIYRDYYGAIVADYIEEFLFVFFILASFRAIIQNRARFVPIVLFAVPCFVLAVANMIFKSHLIFWWYNLITCLFAGLLCVSVIVDVAGESDIGADTIMGGICAYYLIGFVWAFLYAVIYLSNPESFEMTIKNAPSVSGNMISDLWYFSYATLTTIGFGDVVPVSETARAFVILEGVVGQIYLVVFIARLLGLHLTRRESKSS